MLVLKDLIYVPKWTHKTSTQFSTGAEMSPRHFRYQHLMPKSPKMSWVWSVWHPSRMRVGVFCGSVLYKWPSGQQWSEASTHHGHHGHVFVSWWVYGMSLLQATSYLGNSCPMSAILLYLWQGAYVFISVCLSVCLLTILLKVLDYRILWSFLGEGG